MRVGRGARRPRHVRGQGLSFVAGTVALDYFTDDVLMTEVDAKGAVMAERLDAIAARHPDLGWQVRGKGMMQGLDVVDGAVAAKHRPRRSRTAC